MLTLLLFASLSYLVVTGIGIWGNNVPIGWAFDITNFVWWIGIGHAGTTHLRDPPAAQTAVANLHQPVRRGDDALRRRVRGHLPLFHTGRPWLAYWMVPYPNTMGVWPQFQALIWDVFAVSTYATVSLLFWFVGLSPIWRRATAVNREWEPWCRHARDGLARIGASLAPLRDGVLLLAGLATPLVVSVHTVVSFDFAIAIVPGWHTTIFPPYFVAGAIYSGFAMVLTLAIPIRAIYSLEDFITMRHLQNMAKVMLVTGSSSPTATRSGVHRVVRRRPVRGFMIWNRMTGPYAPVYGCSSSSISCCRSFSGSNGCA
jgi:molybdopterin-containing oxidoreductase family membrane subunit